MEKIWLNEVQDVIKASEQEQKEENKNSTPFMLNYVLGKINDDSLKTQISDLSTNGHSGNEIKYSDLKKILKENGYSSDINEKGILVINEPLGAEKKSPIVKNTKEKLVPLQEEIITTNDISKPGETITIVDNREKYGLMKGINPNEKGSEYADYQTQDGKELFFSDSAKDEVENTYKDLKETIALGGTIDGTKVEDTDFYKNIELAINLIKKQNYFVAENNIPEKLKKVA